MQREYKWLVCLVKHSNTSWIFKEIKNWMVPSACVCYFWLYHQKLFIHTNQAIQTNKYNPGKRSKHREVEKVAKHALLYLNWLEGCWGVGRREDRIGEGRGGGVGGTLRQGGRLAALDKSSSFNCMQTMWASWEGEVESPYGKLPSLIRRRMNTYMLLLMCHSNDLIYLRYIFLSGYTHTHIHKYLWSVLNSIFISILKR